MLQRPSQPSMATSVRSRVQETVSRSAGSRTFFHVSALFA